MANQVPATWGELSVKHSGSRFSTTFWWFPKPRKFTLVSIKEEREVITGFSRASNSKEEMAQPVRALGRVLTVTWLDSKVTEDVIAPLTQPITPSP